MIINTIESSRKTTQTATNCHLKKRDRRLQGHSTEEIDPDRSYRPEEETRERSVGDRCTRSTGYGCAAEELESALPF